MKKVFIVLVSLFAMMAASTGLKAQEVTILLRPGWNWIGYPFAESIDLEVAFGDFVPMNDDVIQSFWGYSEYATGFGWFGGIDELRPGWGYMYYSNRTEPVNIVLGTPIDLPTVTTSSATNITTYGLTCGGEVTDSGNSGVLVRGVCWSTQQNPTINDPHTTDGYGLGNFTSAVEGLEMNTTYYVRAYAMTTTGTGYGEQIMLSTKNGVPTLTTSAASEIGTTWATCGGDISDDGGMEVTERGICWSTSPNPTIEGNHGSNGAGLGSFSVNMNNLEPNTTYYVRAYATNGYTTAYGNEVFFHTEVAQTWQNGILPGQFSVSATHQVQFSQGNLQYRASTDTWRFARYQYDCIGSDNSNISSSYDGYIDLFGWGTSGNDHGAVCYQPWSTSKTSSDYFAYGSYQYNLNDQTGQADWGYNAIINGGNQENLWHTLTRAEWYYLLNNRTTTSGIRYAKAKVNDVNGMILLPDNWNSNVHALNNTNLSGAPFSENEITAADWIVMESSGAVFLPASGDRYGTSVYGFGSEGDYWTASYYSGVYSWAMVFYDGSFGIYLNEERFYGRSVRLAQYIQVYSIEATPNPAEGGTVTGQGNYNSDASCTLTATPNEGFIFTNWTENGEVVSTEATYSFTVTSDRTLVANFLQGAINGKFTISDNGDQVYFSQGNLQYQASTETWRFAENQWDYVGTQTPDYSGAFGGTIDGSDNGYISQTYSGWIDLFGWGTSGWDCGNTYYQPWDSNDGGAYYGPSGYSTLTGSYANSDWGVYNAIINGGNQQNHWRALNIAEWRYLFNTRNTVSGIRYVKANVCNVNGLILLPDDWDSSYYSLNYTNQNGSSFSENIITASQWSTIEQQGAVFLPAAGYRNITNVIDAGVNGRYWSTSYAYASSSQVLGFNEPGLNPGYVNTRSEGLSVRLVCNAE